MREPRPRSRRPSRRCCASSRPPRPCPAPPRGRCELHGTLHSVRVAGDAAVGVGQPRRPGVPRSRGVRHPPARATRHLGFRSRDPLLPRCPRSPGSRRRVAFEELLDQIPEYELQGEPARYVSNWAQVLAVPASGVRRRPEHVSIEPFTVAVGDDVWTTSGTARAHPVAGPDSPATGWEYGTDLDYLRDLVGYWADGFDWRAVEARINGWPQGIATIDGQPIHFIHARCHVRTPCRSSSSTAGPLGGRDAPSSSRCATPSIDRAPRRLLRRRLCLAARIRLFRADHRTRVASAPHRRRHGGAHGTPRLRALRHPGR